MLAFDWSGRLTWDEVLLSNKSNRRPDSLAIFRYVVLRRRLDVSWQFAPRDWKLFLGRFSPVTGLACQVRPPSQGAARECIFVMYLFGCMPAS